MINVSDQLLEESKENQDYYVTANVVLADGTKLKLEKDDFYLDGNGIVDSADSSDFPVGVAIEKTASISLVNDENQFSSYSFNRAVFEIYMNLELSGGKIESFKRGSFVVAKKPAIDDEITLTLLDGMCKTDRDYDTNITFPCTAGELLLDSCQSCGIVLGDAAFKNDDFQVMKKPTGTTHRAVIGMIAALAGGNARLDENDMLRIVTYQKIDKDNFSGVELIGVDDIETDVDTIVVTGVKYTADKQDYIYGAEGYMINLKNNQLLSGNEQDGINRIGEILTGFEILPFSASAVPMGYVTFGDAVKFEDYRGNTYYSYATDVDFTFADSTGFSCRAKSVENQDATYPSESRVLVEQAKREILENMSAYDAKLKQLNDMAANTLGFYSTQETLADGSVITYRHDKPTLAESKIIYKTGIDGFFLSVDGGETWKSGFDSNGDAVLNILYAIGIQAEWINTRGLTAKGNDGNITFRVNADTGEVEIDPEHFRLGSKNLSEALDSIKNIALQLSNEYQGIPVDHDGNYTEFPAGISTTATVLYGSNDISADCTYTVSQSAAITGNWDADKRTYTVTGLSADTGEIVIRATYLSTMSVSKKFTIFKVYAGEKGDTGEPGELYSMECSDLVVKQVSGGYLYPYCLEFHGYRSGSQKRLPYSGRFVIEETADGTTWNTVYTSAEDEQEVIHSLYTAIGTESGKLIATADGNVLVTSRNIVEIRASLYAAGGTTELIDRQTIPVVVDMSALTHEDIFNLLTDDGRIKGIYKEGDQLYINATYLRSLHVTGDQVDAKKLKVTSADGTVTLYISDDGEVDLKVRSFSLAGKSVGDIAQAAVDGQTQEDIFNKLSNNGTIRGIKLIDGELYFSFSYASGGTLTLGGANNGDGLLRILDASGNQIGYIDNTGVNFGQGSFSGKIVAGDGAIAGWKIRTDYLESEDGTIRLYKNGRIVFGGDSGATLSANGKNIDIKNGLVLHTKRPDSGFSDFTGEFQLLNLGKVTSSKALAVDSNGVVGYIASSSRRYKDHIRRVTDEEAQKLLDLPVVWYQYKKGYLNAGDPMEDKAMPGFYAEDVAEAIPELAIYDGEQVEDWNYRTMIPMLLKLIQNQEERIRKLENKIGGRL